MYSYLLHTVLRLSILIQLLQLTCERLESEASDELPQRTKESSASSVSNSGSIRAQLVRIEELAIAADALPVYLPAVERLRDISSRAADILDGLANICDPVSKLVYCTLVHTRTVTVLMLDEYGY